MNKLFIGDLHLGHKNIVGWRPKFKNIDEHDQYLYTHLMNRVGNRTILYLMGDICLDINKFHMIEDIARKSYEVHLIAGNHDFERKGSPSIYDYLTAGVQVHGFVKSNEFWLSHAPIHPDELRGRINIHGHVHNCTIDDDRYVNVSCDNTGYQPISLTDIRQIINSRKI